jgi:hypothetical protein
MKNGKRIPTIDELLKKHKVSRKYLEKQLAMGIKVEHEHTRDSKVAMGIALQHLDEFPDYYTRLKRVESGKKTMKEETKSGDHGLHDWFNKSKSSDGKKGWVQLGGKYAGKPCARQPGQTSTPKCGSSKMSANMSDKEEERARRRKNRLDPNQPEKTGAAKPTNVRTEEMDLHEVKDKPGKGSGKKDACYHKVKSRFKVWPSAYGSGALVKCRKVGAKNWGTKSEEVQQMRYCPKCQKNETREECSYGEKYWNMFSLPAMIVSTKKPFSIAKVHPANEETELQSEACWKGYTQKGMKKKGKRMVPNCVPVDESCGCEHTTKKKKKKEKEEVTENYSRINELGGTYTISLIWRNKTFVLQIFFPTTKVPSRAEVKAQIEKVYPGSYLVTYRPSTIDPTKPLLFKTEEYSQVDEDWQKVNRKDKTDGLSQKAVDAYKRENPGSKLQTAVTEKNPKGKRAKRRASFCRRMKGMRSKLTSSKTANDPNSRINKALRRWNC